MATVGLKGDSRIAKPTTPPAPERRHLAWIAESAASAARSPSTQVTTWVWPGAHAAAKDASVVALVWTVTSTP